MMGNMLATTPLLSHVALTLWVEKDYGKRDIKRQIPPKQPEGGVSNAGRG